MAEKTKEKRKATRTKKSPTNSDLRSIPEVVDKDRTESAMNEGDRLAQMLGVGPTLDQRLVEAAGTPGQGLTDQQLTAAGLPANVGPAPGEAVDPATDGTQVDPRVAQIALQILGQQGGGETLQGGAETAQPEVEPLPTYSIKDRLMNLGSVLPLVGGHFSKGIDEVDKRRAQIKAVDKDLYDKALELMDTNPDAAAEWMKNKNVMAAFERHAGLDKEAIEGLAETSKNLPLSMADTIRLFQSGGELDEKGNLVPPSEVDTQARAAKRKEGEKEIERVQKELGNNATRLDAITALGRAEKGQTSNELKIIDDDLWAINPITLAKEKIVASTIKKSNMIVHTLRDKVGTPNGIALIDTDQPFTINADGSIEGSILPIYFADLMAKRMQALIERQGKTIAQIDEDDKRSVGQYIREFLQGLGVLDDSKSDPEVVTQDSVISAQDLQNMGLMGVSTTATSTIPRSKKNGKGKGKGKGKHPSEMNKKEIEDFVKKNLG
jgi:hypothetical protein